MKTSTQYPLIGALALAPLALAPLAALVACGDPLLDAGDPGPPAMVLDGRIVGLAPSEANQPASAALIWTTLSTPLDPFERHAVRLVPDDVGDFQLQVFGRPDRRIVERLDPDAPADADPPTAALAFLAVLEGADAPPFIAARMLGDSVRGLAHEHLFLWTHRPDAARAVLADIVLNPDELVEGMNLVVGLCRPGRPSELLVVPPERLAIVDRDDVPDGGCVDVFWGDWRAE